MNAINKTFGKSRVLLPVVHCIEPVQVHRAIAAAMENGADGVWLINQGGMSWRLVVDSAESAVRGGVPFVGVNLLGLLLGDALLGAGAVHGLWTDGAGFENDSIDSRDADWFKYLRAETGWEGTYFGGVAFKYKREVPFHMLPALAQTAVACGVDVITTSGPATGVAPTVEKIAAMRGAIGNHALAIASGITPDNVAPFLPLCDAFLVASGIESSFGVFDPAMVRALADAIHASTTSQPDAAHDQ